MWSIHAGKGALSMPELSQDFTTMVETLRAVLETPADAGRPGQLRLRMEAALGPDEAQRLRRLIHQVVGAAEENLPANLRRIAPLTEESLQRLSGELASSRGWSQDAAQRATQIWAAALGFEELAASSWPREPAPARPAPAEPTPMNFEATAPPPGSTTQHARLDHPTPPAQPHTAGPAPWPAPRKSVSAHAQAQSGEPALGVVQAYAGMNMVVGAVLIIVLMLVLLTPVILVGATGFLLPLVGALLASLIVRKERWGALVATESGLEFTPYTERMRKPIPEKSFRADWADVTFEDGYLARFRFAGERVQVGPRNKEFVAAAMPYVGGGAG